MVFKTCSKCHVEKEVSEYYTQIRNTDGFTSYCKLCYKLQRSEAVKNIPGKRHSNNMASVKKLYGITEDQLQIMLWKQQGCCAICGVDFGKNLIKNKGRQYTIDHSHDTGKVRGLLCAACNIYIGVMEKQNSGSSIIKDYITRGW